MSARDVERALARLAGASTVLARTRDGARFGVFANGDRRRRPLARLHAEDVRALSAAGALTPLKEDETYVLSPAGRARVLRTQVGSEEMFLAQHAALVTKDTADADGVRRTVSAVDGGAVLKRLASLRDGAGGPWLSADELRAAARVRADWEASQIGSLRGSDWNAPPLGAAPRGPGNAREAAMAARCDARRRIADALDALAAPLRRTVERVCLAQEGLEALERGEGWPARSAKLALKLALGQLALVLR